MTGLNHEFVVVKKSIIAQKLSYEVINNHRQTVKTLHDDLIQYFADSLYWLNAEGSLGLNYYGYTVFSLAQTQQFKKILQAWHDLFLCAPTTLTLTGGWTTVVGVDNSGEYEKMPLVRDELLESLRAIINLCEQAECEDDLVLLHSGI